MAEIATQTERPIDWLIDVLRGANPAVVVTRRSAPRTHVELERYSVFPSESDPRLIVTASSNRVRSAALRRVGSQSSAAMKLVRRGAAGLARTGLDQLVTGPDIILSVAVAHVDGTG